MSLPAPLAAPATAARVLVVDDDAAVRTALAKYLGRTGYEVLAAGDGAEALEALASHRVAAMVCDIRMPRLPGTELLPRAIAADPDLAILMLTAVGDAESAIECLKLGALDYLIKPVNLDELGHALQYALRKRQLEIDRRELEEWLAREVATKTRQLEEQSRQVELLAMSVLTALVDAIEPREPGHRNHSVRVANVSAHVAAGLGLTSDDIELVRLGARLHDLGRVALKDEGLRRASGASRPPELVGATEAPALAAAILEPLVQFRGVREIARLQRERWDGKGYPEGLRGEAIPIGARIVAAVVLYDQLTEGASAGQALRPAQAMENLRGLAGTLLDPAVVTALERVVVKG